MAGVCINMFSYIIFIDIKNGNSLYIQLPLVARINKYMPFWHLHKLLEACYIIHSGIWLEPVTAQKAKIIEKANSCEVI